MKEPAVSIEPIRFTVRVARSRAEAFELFTAKMSEWWPHERLTFRVGYARESILEPRVGGRLYERYTDGTEYTIGSVTVWDPPARIAFTWKHPDWSESTDVAVTFTAETNEVTRVDLEHRGFERLARAGTSWRERYLNGWPTVLANYMSAASGS